MSTERNRHGIGELARLAGVTPRTIRYYVAQGLLPAPYGVGPGAHYGPGHLERLQLIKRLQRQHLPLAEIRSQLETLGDDEVARLNRAGAERAQPTSSALDYIRSVLGSSDSPDRTRAAAPAPVASMPEPLPMLPRVPPRPTATASELTAMPRMRDAAPRESAEPAPEPATEPSLERSQWERLSLGSNLELHIRRPLGRLEQRRVERLITIARQVLKEELP